ncbi:MAG: hypothetical protein WC582_04440 [Patescibacteria group bacterium]
MDDKKEISQPEIDINRYNAPDSPSSDKLEMGLWLLENKKHLRKALIIFLTVISAISWSYTIYGFAYYIAKGMNEDNILAEQLVNTKTIGHEYILALAPQDISFSPVKIFRGNENKYDFVSEIKNQNSKHWATFKYCFYEKGQEVECGENFIFPGETKSLIALAKNFNYLPREASLTITELFWQKINAREISDWNNYSNEHLDFIFDDIVFKPAAASGLSEKLNFNSLNFSATNKTAFNYWEVPLDIFFYNGNSLIGVNQYVLPEFMSKDKRDIKISWPGNLSGVNSVKIIPNLNIFKDNIYIKYEGGVGEEK